MTPTRRSHNARHARECVEACERTYSEDERVEAFLRLGWGHALPDRQAQLFPRSAGKQEASQHEVKDA
jgi:hypothetical protein